jgi:hypothetical protein
LRDKVLIAQAQLLPKRFDLLILFFQLSSPCLSEVIQLETLNLQHLHTLNQLEKRAQVLVEDALGKL